MLNEAQAARARFAREARRPYEDLVERVPAVLFVCEDGRPTFISPAAEQLLGTPAERYLEEPWRFDRERHRLHEVSTTALEDGVLRTYCALVASDPSRDPVTKLPGRSLLLDHLGLAVARARQEDCHVALLHVGIEGLDLVHAGLGRAAYEHAIRSVARRIRDALPESVMLAAPDDGELAILLSDLDGSADEVAETAAGQVLAAVALPIAVDEEEFALRAAIGGSILPGDAHDAESVMRHANAAMHEAVRSRERDVVLYAGGTSEAVERLLVTGRLRRALERDELTLHFQPIFSLDTGEIRAVEALLRWEDPERGTIPPLSFVPIAEYTGMIEPIGRWVVGACCEQMAAWHAEGIDVAISFNVSLKQFRDPGLVRALADGIAKHDLDPSRFIVEITESVAMRDPSCVEPVLGGLRELGVQLAIDDFGVGHSSLARLRDLEVDLLKIDRAFMRRAGNGTRAGRLLAATLDLVDALDMTPVVEGVESEEQRRFLAERGCALAQGFHLARPLPAAAATALLQRMSVQSAAPSATPPGAK